MRTLAAVAVLFAFLAGAALTGGGDPLGIARAVEAWAGAKVQVAQIDAGVETYRIGIDAVQRANDRGLMYMALGAALVLVVLFLPRILRHYESEGDHYERMSREQDAAAARRREVLRTTQSVHAAEYTRAGYHLSVLPSDAEPLDGDYDLPAIVAANPTRHRRNR